MKPGEVFYYADEFNVSWLPTLEGGVGTPKGQQVMIPDTGQATTTPFGIGAVNYHTGETGVIVRFHKRRSEIAELLRALVDKHRHETVYIG